MKKILILAGEESGLLYAKSIASRLHALPGGCETRGYSDYGFKTADLAVMGFGAVFMRLFYFLRVRRTMERAIREWRPDAVCTIDYPGMNLVLAAYAKKLGIKTLHVVCPQVWAWKKGRIPKIEASVDSLCCFFPFEPALFRPGFAFFAGHPLVEEFRRAELSAERVPNLVALLPGSRIGEIERNLPIMLEAAAKLPGATFRIPAASPQAEAAIRRIVAASGIGVERLSVCSGNARDTLLRARCAVVASGTATLEAALARCPTVLVYRIGRALAWFARRVIREIRHVGLLNVVWEKCDGAGDAPMPELLQEDYTSANVIAIVKPWLEDDAECAKAAKRLDGALALFGSGPCDPIDEIVRRLS